MGFSTITGKPRSSARTPKLDRAPVVGEHEDGVEILPVEQRVVARQRVDAAVRAPQALAEARIRIGRGHDPADLAGGERGEIAPDVIVGQSENADAQSGHVRQVSPSHAAVAIARSRALRKRAPRTDRRLQPSRFRARRQSGRRTRESGSGTDAGFRQLPRVKVRALTRSLDFPLGGTAVRGPTRSWLSQSTPAISTRHTGPFRNIAPSKRTNAGMSPRASQ